MGMTLFSLAGAMLLISKLVRTGKGPTRAGSDVTVWILGITTGLALLSGYAWFRNADTMPALICALTTPFLFLFPGTTRMPVRVVGILMITAGASCLIGLATGGAGDLNGAETRGAGRPGPLIIFDDASRRQELLARVRACEIQLNIAMLRDTGDDASKREENAPNLASLKAEVESILRMLETADGASAPTALRLARLESRIRAENIPVE